MLQGDILTEAGEIDVNAMNVFQIASAGIVEGSSETKCRMHELWHGLSAYTYQLCTTITIF